VNDHVAGDGRQFQANGPSVGPDRQSMPLVAIVLHHYDRHAC
jgi:hypothetical protein